MRLLIIGASGFIGSHLYTLAKEKGYTVVGTSSQGSGSFLKFDLLSDSITNVLYSSFAEPYENTYAVICAAVSRYNECALDRERSYKINVLNTIRTIRELNNLGIKTVFFSSDAVYDGIKGYYNEQVLPCPINEYGRQKAEVEQYIISNMPENLVLRLSVTVGEILTDSHLFAQWYKSVQDSRTISCIAGQIFTPTYVRDIAEGTIQALEINLKGLYNFANTEYFSREELAQQFLLGLNLNAEIIIKPMEHFGFYEKRSLKTYLETTKIRKVLELKFTSMREVFNKILLARNPDYVI